VAQSVTLGDTIHASAVVIDGTGILILGPSGAGKSALALDLIDQCILRDISAALIGDDRLVVSFENGQYLASPAANLTGLIEVRGSGIHKTAHVDKAALHLAVRLVPENQAVRMPEAVAVEILPGIRLPLLTLPQGHAAVRAVLAHLGHYGGIESSVK
jgi:serine kinase of HPr protein (carbohydrate metabolism regulator)